MSETLPEATDPQGPPETWPANDREVVARATEAARELLAPAAARLDAEGAFPDETLRELGRRGLLSIHVPRAEGGLGASPIAYARAVRELASACPATTVALMVTNMVAEAIAADGTEAQRASYLRPLTEGRWPAAAFSLSEPGAGSDAAALRTVARRDGEDYILEGTKAWVTSGGHAGVYLVMASTDPAARARGITTFLVEPGTPGFTPAPPEHKMGLRGSATTELIFEACRLPAIQRLGPEGNGFKVAMRALDGGRIGVSAQALGVARGAMEVALRHVRSEGVEGRSADFPLRMARWAESRAELEAGWLLCLRAAGLKAAGRPFTREAAMSKLYCTEAAGRAVERCLALVPPGAPLRGEVERRLRDVRVTRIYEGTSEVQRVVIARELRR